MMKKGRVNELKLGLSLYFKDGFVSVIKESLKHQKLGMNMMKAKRMSVTELFGGHGVKDISDLQKIIKKAQEIETTRIESYGK
jgi:quinone-modifying oxidoreductase subunit QmoC